MTGNHKHLKMADIKEQKRRMSNKNKNWKMSYVGCQTSSHNKRQTSKVKMLERMEDIKQWSLDVRK